MDRRPRDSWHAEVAEPQASRRATIGSTAVARRTGSDACGQGGPATTRTAASNATGSVGPTPVRKARSNDAPRAPVVQADAETDRQQRRVMTQDEPHDVAARGADGAANANLARALDDAERDETIDAERRQRHGERSKGASGHRADPRRHHGNRHSVGHRLDEAFDAGKQAPQFAWHDDGGRASIGRSGVQGHEV